MVKFKSNFQVLKQRRISRDVVFEKPKIRLILFIITNLKLFATRKAFFILRLLINNPLIRLF